MVEMRVYGLAVESETDSPVLVLKNESLGTVLPIWIGAMEAMAISMVLNDVSLPRPMTHDLLLSIITQLGGKVLSVDITAIEKGTFYAEVVIKCKDGVKKIDARPSDAVALAIRADCILRVSQDVLDLAGTKDIEGKISEKSRWDEEFEGLSPDDFKYKM